jgi:hypothetical protein
VGIRPKNAFQSFYSRTKIKFFMVRKEIWGMGREILFSDFRQPKIQTQQFRQPKNKVHL